MNILLDYFFPVTAVEGTAQASTSFLKQALAVVKPKVGVTPGTITLCTSQSQVAAITDNLDVAQLFAAGMNRVYVLAVAALGDVDTALPGHESDFFTMLISSDFTAANFSGLDVNEEFKGVIAFSGLTADAAILEAAAVVKNVVAFHTTSGTKAKNMFFAMGKFLAAAGWKNQQYIQVPFADDVDTLGEANALFDDKISFVISDSEYGNRLGLLAVGGKAITAPYILKNLEIDMQSDALNYVTANQPAYTKKEAALMESQLQKRIEAYIARSEIEAGTVEIQLQQSNFIASGYINVSEPNALWRVVSEMKQTL